MFFYFSLVDNILLESQVGKHRVYAIVGHKPRRVLHNSIERIIL